MNSFTRQPSVMYLIFVLEVVLSSNLILDTNEVSYRMV